jgi:hypothetical protein
MNEGDLENSTLVSGAVNVKYYQLVTCYFGALLLTGTIERKGCSLSYNDLI